MKFVRCLAFFGVLGSLPISSSCEEVTGLPDGLYAEFTTPRGSVVCELYFQKAPLTVTNFVGLAEGTLGPSPRKPFFNGLTFHRIVPGFVVQGGDPLGTGEGGPGYVFPDEFVPGLRHNAAGILAMANQGPDTNGSQFFFTLAPVNRLNYLHSVFGRTVTGAAVLSQIKAGDTMSVKILRRGLAAEKFSADETTFAKLVAAGTRAKPLAFDDITNLLQTDPPRAKALDTKLENFRRFTKIRLYVRLYEKFGADRPGQTPAQFVESLAGALSVGNEGVLAVWFATENQWHLFAPGHPHLKLPAIQSWPALALSPVPSAEQIASDQKRRLLSVLNDVIDGLIFQLESEPTSAGNRLPRPSSPAQEPTLQPLFSHNKT